MSTNTLPTSTTAVAAESALSTTIDGETVILHQDIGRYYGLNEVGTLVWELLEEPRSVEKLCQTVAEDYDVEYSRCRSDVEDLLVDLAEKDLVRLDAS